MRKGAFSLLLALAGSWVVGCNGGQDEEAPTSTVEVGGGAAESETTANGEPVPPAQVGTIRGRIRLAEGAPLPLLPPYEPTQTNSPAPDFCGPPQVADRRPVSRSQGGLSGVLVSTTGDPVKFLRELRTRRPQRHEMFIDNCRLRPLFDVVVRNDTLVLNNPSGHGFVPRVDNGTQAALVQLRAFTPQLRSLEFAMPTAGTHKVSCSIGDPCGESTVIVMAHPVFTLSGRGGEFVIENVPANQDIGVHAWHPLFEASNAEIHVEAGQIHEMDFVLRPLSQAAPAETGEQASEGEAAEAGEAAAEAGEPAAAAEPGAEAN